MSSHASSPAQPLPSARFARIPARADLGLVFLVAAGVRAAVIFGSAGGLGGNFGYDEGVYFAASDALVHGRMPYADYVLLHPPGMVLALLPFTGLAQLIGDHPAFMVGNVAFAVLGAANAVMVSMIARRLGWGRPAALVGGLFYAMWFGAVIAEFSARLEPLGGALFLGAIVVKLGNPDSRRRCAVAGVLLAAAVSVKVWWCLPALIVAAYWLWWRPPAERRALLLGGLATVVLVDLPFFIRAPATMWRMVVADQLQRTSGSRTARVIGILGIRRAIPHVHVAGAAVVGVVVGLIMIAVAVAAWRLAAARWILVVLAAQVVVLLQAPSFFLFYADYLAGPAALMTAAAIEVGTARTATPGSPAPPFGARAGAVLAVGVLALAGAGTAVALLAYPINDITPFPASRLAADTRHVRCVQSDAPIALIEMNALSRDLANDCRNWVDVTGRTYELRPEATSPTQRAHSRAWQRELVGYLRSGDAAIVVRARDSGLGTAALRRVECGPVLAAAARYRVYSTNGPRC